MENLLSASSKKHNTKANRVNEREILTASPFEILCAAEERINPAILLAEELMLKAMTERFDFAEIEQAEEILVVAREEISRTETHFTALVKTPATPAASIPLGF